MTAPLPTAVPAAYNGDGVIRNFGVPWTFDDANDIKAAVTDAGVTTEFANAAGFIVTGDANAGFEVLFDTAPAAGVNNVILWRAQPSVNTTNLKDLRRFPAETVEAMIDRIARAGQDAQALKGFSIQLSPTDWGRMKPFPPISQAVGKFWTVVAYTGPENFDYEISFSPSVAAVEATAAISQDIAQVAAISADVVTIAQPSVVSDLADLAPIWQEIQRVGNPTNMAAVLVINADLNLGASSRIIAVATNILSGSSEVLTVGVDLLQGVNSKIAIVSAELSNSLGNLNVVGADLLIGATSLIKVTGDDLNLGVNSLIAQAPTKAAEALSSAADAALDALSADQDATAADASNTLVIANVAEFFSWFPHKNTGGPFTDVADLQAYITANTLSVNVGAIYVHATDGNKPHVVTNLSPLTSELIANLDAAEATILTALVAGGFTGSIDFAAGLTSRGATVKTGFIFTSRIVTSPPTSPVEGEHWLLPSSAPFGGAWSLFPPGSIVGFTKGAYVAFPPEKHFTAIVEDESDRFITYDGAAWKGSRLAQPEYPAAAFGIKPNVATDQTSLIQTALAFIAAGTLVFEAANYVAEGTVSSSVAGVSVKGQGNHSTKFTTSVNRTLDATGNPVFDLTGDGASVEDIWIESTYAGDPVDETESLGAIASITGTGPYVITFATGGLTALDKIRNVDTGYFESATGGSTVASNLNVPLDIDSLTDTTITVTPTDSGQTLTTGSAAAAAYKFVVNPRPPNDTDTGSGDDGNCGIRFWGNKDASCRNVRITGNFYHPITLSDVDGFALKRFTAAGYVNRGIAVFRATKDLKIDGFDLDGTRTVGEANYGPNLTPRGYDLNGTTITNGTVRNTGVQGVSFGGTVDNTTVNNVHIFMPTTSVESTVGILATLIGSNRGGRVSIDNVSVNGAESGIILTGADEVSLDNYRVSASDLRSIFITNCNDVRVGKGLIKSDGTSDGLYVSNSGSVSIDGIDSKATGLTNINIRLEGVASATFSNVDTDGGKYGIYLIDVGTSTNNIIMNNCILENITGTGGAGILVQDSSDIIGIGVQITGSGSVSASGINITSTALDKTTDIEFHGVNIDGKNDLQHGVLVQASVANGTRRVKFIGGTVKNCTGNGLLALNANVDECEFLDVKSYGNGTDITNNSTNGKTRNDVGVNSAYAESTTKETVSTTTVHPIDDTVPVLAHGDLLTSVAITPRKSASKLSIRAKTHVSGDLDRNAILFVTKDTDNAAIGAAIVRLEAVSRMRELTLDFEVDATDTTARTYKLYLGRSNGTIYALGTSSTRLLGGAMKTTLSVTEIEAQA
jgi:uncharacterized protein DUF2793